MVDARIDFRICVVFYFAQAVFVYRTKPQQNCKILNMKKILACMLTDEDRIIISQRNYQKY